MTLYIDLETFSTVPIKNGVYRYAEEARVLLFAYALDDGPVEVWDVDGRNFPSQGLSWCLRKIKALDGELCAHNSNFDRVILDRSPFASIFKNLKWCDTMVRAYQHSLPGPLGQLSEIFRLPVDAAKDKEGKKLVQLFCKPDNKGKIANRETHPELWAQFIEYARLDVIAMRELDKKIPKWNDFSTERNYWYLDQKINDRGFAVDLDLARSAVEAVEKVKKENDKRTLSATAGAVSAATQRDAMLKHLLEVHGVDLPDMTISTLTRRLEDPDLPEPVKELIGLRLQAAGTSATKYKTLLGSVCADGRLRGTLQFCGAWRSGRISGKIMQPQNLPRPTMKNADIELGIEALKVGAADLFFDDVKDLASNALRGCIVAPEGKKLVVADLSAIEGRILAWLAGERWKVKAYADYDKGLGFDMYVLTYARTFGVLPETVTKDQRQLGKVLELALGYAGGVGAFVTFAKGYNIDLDALADQAGDMLPPDIYQEAQQFWEYSVKHKRTLDLDEKTFIFCDGVKRMWRAANPAISALWRSVEDAVYIVLRGAADRSVRDRFTFDKVKSWGRFQLPSGRFMCYPSIKVEDESLKFLGINPYNKKWGSVTTYGGKLVENLTQGIARDVLMHGMALAESAGYNVVLSVHDELITEAPDSPEYNAEELSEIMSTVPVWAEGLPLAAAGFESKRYKKE